MDLDEDRQEILNKTMDEKLPTFDILYCKRSINYNTFGLHRLNQNNFGVTRVRPRAGNRYPPKNYPRSLLPAGKRVRVEFSKIAPAPAFTRRIQRSNFIFKNPQRLKISLVFEFSPRYLTRGFNSCPKRAEAS